MSNIVHRAAAQAGRPLLLLPNAAEQLARRVLAADPRALDRPSGFGALVRRLGALGRRPAALEDEPAYVTPTRPSAYAPVWLGAADDEGEWGWTLKDGVALLSIDTVLMARGEHFCGSWWHGYDTLRAALDEIDADARVRGVFIHMETPGGVVANGLDDLAARIRDLRTRKPVHVFADMAASAGYWIAAQATRVTSGRFGLIGSIGVVVVHHDLSKAYDEYGLKVTPIQFGAFKTDGAEWSPLDEGARARLQSDVDSCGAAFVAAVVEGRPSLAAEAVIATQADCYLADHADPARSALALGLIDAITTEQDAFAALAADVGGGSTAAPPSPQPRATRTAGQRGSAASDGPPAAVAPVPASPGRAAVASTESEVKKSTLAAILGNAAMSAAAKVAAIQAQMDEEEEAGATDPASDPETDPATEGAAAPGAPATDEPEDEDEEPVDAKVAQAVLTLPEARGREALAQKLAFTPGMTVARAKGLLEAAPKASTLAERMAGRDPRVGPHGDSSASTAADALRADARRRAGLAPANER